MKKLHIFWGFLQDLHFFAQSGGWKTNHHIGKTHFEISCCGHCPFSSGVLLLQVSFNYLPQPCFFVFDNPTLAINIIHCGMNRLPFLLHLEKDNQRYFFHTISPWLVWWLSLLWFGFVHPFLFLVLQQRQKTNHTSPSTSPGILLTTLSPRGRQSKILSSVLFHLRCPPWSLKEEYHNFFLILPFPPRGAWANEFENSCDLQWNLQYLSWILP